MSCGATLSIGRPEMAGLTGMALVFVPISVPPLLRVKPLPPSHSVAEASASESLLDLPRAISNFARHGKNETCTLFRPQVCLRSLNLIR